MFIAFVRIEIGLALLVFYSYPAFVALASVIWFGDRLDLVRWSALGLSMLGLALTLSGSGGVGTLDALGIGLVVPGRADPGLLRPRRRATASPRIPPVEAAAMTMGGAAARLPGHRRWSPVSWSPSARPLPAARHSGSSSSPA